MLDEKEFVARAEKALGHGLEKDARAQLLLAYHKTMKNLSTSQSILFTFPEYIAWDPGTRSQVPGTRYLVPGTRSQVPGTRYLLPGTRYLVPGTWFWVPCTRYLGPEKK